MGSKARLVVRVRGTDVCLQETPGPRSGTSLEVLRLGSDESRISTIPTYVLEPVGAEGCRQSEIVATASERGLRAYALLCAFRCSAASSWFSNVGNSASVQFGEQLAS